MFMLKLQRMLPQERYLSQRLLPTIIGGNYLSPIYFLIVGEEFMTEKYADLIAAAKEAYENAYAPYSKFHVGAALKLKDGNIINGANVENASFGLTNCAERSALFTAFTKGYRRDDIEAIVVVANTDRPISPCGACRQVISELMPKHAQVILLSNKDEVKTYTVEELLPYSFASEDL